MSKKKIIILVLALLLILTACNASLIRILAANWFSHKEKLNDGTWEGGQSYFNVQYSDVSDTNYLHLFVPDSDEKLPLYIMFHG